MLLFYNIYTYLFRYTKQVIGDWNKMYKLNKISRSMGGNGYSSILVYLEVASLALVVILIVAFLPLFLLSLIYKFEYKRKQGKFSKKQKTIYFILSLLITIFCIIFVVKIVNYINSM